jgi:sugar lactone lactonase YvrE
MPDNAGREIIHHRDIHLRSIDGALLVLDSFEFTEAGDYTVGPVWHVQNIKSIDTSTVIAGDGVQIDTTDSKAAEAPSNMRFDFISDSPGVTIVHNTSVPAGRHPQKEHFAAALPGARAAGDFVKLLTIIRPGEPDAPFNIEYSPLEKRYINYTDDMGRVVAGINPFTTIDNILPDYAVIPGTDIKILGRNLSHATKVFMGAYEIPAGAWTIDNDRQITVRLPTDIPSTGYVTVYSNPERGEGTSPRLYTLAVTIPTHQPLPESQIVVAGKKITLAASSGGNPQPSWQWQVSKDGGKTWEDVEGATGSTLEVSFVTTGMNGWKYRYQVKNYHSSAVSEVFELRVMQELLRRPASMVIDANNDIYIGDSGLFTINRIGNDGKFVKIAGTIGTSGTTAGRFVDPAGIGIRPNETLVVSDAGPHRIYTDIDPGKTLRGEQTTYRTVSDFDTGSITAPTGIATDSTGAIYFADAADHILVRMTETSGTSWSLLTVAGSKGTAGMVDGGIAPSALFDTPTGIALDEIGQVLYVADTGNHAIRIIDLATGAVTLFAGAFGDPGSDDGVLLDARFNAPRGIIIDGDMLYVADTDNSTIRAIDTAAGTVTTIAGSPGLHAMIDETGANARFDHPRALAMDTNGIIYVADTENGAIRKLTPDNKVTTPIWDDYYKFDTAPPNSKDGLLNKGEGGGGGALSLWMFGAFAALLVVRRTMQNKSR